jgi:septation ring formation regulator EzrA
MDTNKRLSLNLPKPLDDWALEERFDSYLDETTESIEFMGVTLIPHRFLKDNDETAYRCAFNDWLDSEYRSNGIVEYGGSYYAYDVIDSAIDETVQDVEAELSSIQDDITAAEEKLAEIDEGDAEAREPIEDKITALRSTEEDLQAELKELNNLR